MLKMLMTRIFMMMSTVIMMFEMRMIMTTKTNDVGDGDDAKKVDDDVDCVVADDGVAERGHERVINDDTFDEVVLKMVVVRILMRSLMMVLLVKVMMLAILMLIILTVMV